jgi:hypothetical protein
MRRRTWMRVVEVPGSSPTRRIQITYQRLRHGPDEPERERRHGWILLFTWPIFAALALFLTFAWVTEPSLGEIVGPFAVISGLYALGYLVNGAFMRKRGARNRAKRSYVGRVVDHDIGQAIGSEGDLYSTYFLAVDDGSERTYGWEVDPDRCTAVPVGTVVRVVVSADGQYLYGIALPPPGGLP